MIEQPSLRLLETHTCEVALEKAAQTEFERSTCPTCGFPSERALIDYSYVSPSRRAFEASAKMPGYKCTKTRCGYEYQLYYNRALLLRAILDQINVTPEELITIRQQLDFFDRIT